MDAYRLEIYLHNIIHTHNTIHDRSLRTEILILILVVAWVVKK